MTFRPTTLERAYQLAESGTCRTVSEVKSILSNEGYASVHDQLYGPTTTRALRLKCEASYVAPKTETAAKV